MSENNTNKGGTIYQNLNKFLNIDTIGGNQNITTGTNASPNSQNRKIIIKGNTPEEIYRKGLELEQKQKLQDKFFRTSDRGFQKAMQYEAARLPAYIDYEGMEYYPIIASALDLFMEEATTIGSTGKMLNIYSNKERIRLTLEDFFYNIVNVNVNLPFWTRNLPVKYDSIVPLLNGENITIKEISERLKNNPNEDLYTYAVQDITKNIVVGKIIWCDLTRQNTQIYRIHLDDGTFVETTPDHEFMIRNGSYKRADQLLNNDSLIAFYTLISEGLKSNKNVLTNHKVLFIEKLDNNYDAYCMEVVGPNNEQDRHNFPICGKNENGEYQRNGVFVSNCKYGDNFVGLYGERKKGITSVRQLVNYEIERFERVQEGKMSVKFKERMTGDEFNTFEMAHFRLLGDDKMIPYGSCLDGDTLIKTSNGVKKIKNICVNDLVISFDLKTQTKVESKVLNTIHSGKKETFKISTVHNYIDSSKEHKLLIYDTNINDFKYEFVENIKLGDKLVINYEDLNNNIKTIDKTIESTFDRFKREFKYFQNINCIPNAMTVDFAKFIGFMYGDGWISKGNEVAFALGEHSSLNIRYLSLLEKFSGVKPRLLKPQVKTNYEFTQAVVGSKMLSTILAKLDFIGKSHTKSIPQWVFDSPYEIREAFLDGFIDADGSLFIDKWNCCRYSIELCNKDLVAQLKYLVQSLGYKSGKISTRSRIGRTPMISNRIINSENAYYFYFFKSKNKQTKTHEINNRLTNEFIIEPIISIENIGQRDVYDIYVENENHNFYANNIVVHNSTLNKVRRCFRQLVLAEDAMLTYRLIRAGEKKVFKIDVGNIDEDDVEEYMYKVSEKFKRTPQIDQNNGQIDYRFNIMGVDEDFFIPVRNANVQTGIDTLPGACLALDTKIELLDGRSLELKNIISEYESGKQLWGYSINPETGEIVPGKITWAGVTRKDTQVLKITLDNGETITCTPDHKFNTRIGDVKEAKYLNVRESLWSFNKRFKQIKNSRNKYEQIYDHNLKKWIYTHRMVSNNIKLEDFIFDIKTYGFGKCNVIDHKDFINDKNGEFYNEFFKLNKDNKQLESNSIRKLVKHFNYENLKELNKEISLYNHKIISIEYLSEKQDTGTITIDGNEEFHNFHNFALTCGVFTKNSNLNDINDISYLRDNLFIGLSIPKPFLSFADASGGGKNIAQFDIRFAKKINRIQQAMIQELNKMAMIHLYYLGFEAEDLNNFALSLTNPSTQQELLKIELMQAKAQVYTDMTRAEAGIAAMSHTNAKRQILNMSDSDIIEDLRQQKMEKVIMQEFADSPVIIKKTGLFTDIDKRYGVDSENISSSGKTPSNIGNNNLSPSTNPSDEIGTSIPGNEEGEIPPPIAGLPNQTPSELPPIKESDKLRYNKYINNLVYGENHKENNIKQETNKLIIENDATINNLNNKANDLILEIENIISDKKHILVENVNDDSELNLNDLNLDEDI